MNCMPVYEFKVQLTKLWSKIILFISLFPSVITYPILSIWDTLYTLKFSGHLCILQTAKINSFTARIRYIFLSRFGPQLHQKEKVYDAGKVGEQSRQCVLWFNAICLQWAIDLYAVCILCQNTSHSWDRFACDRRHSIKV